MPKKKKKRVKKKTLLLTIISLGVIIVSIYVFSTYFFKISIRLLFDILCYLNYFQCFFYKYIDKLYILCYTVYADT